MATFNPFSPYVRLTGLVLADAPPVPHHGRLYYELLGGDIWLVVDGQRFYASNSDGRRLSSKFWNPAYAVEAASRLSSAGQIAK